MSDKKDDETDSTDPENSAPFKTTDKVMRVFKDKLDNLSGLKLENKNIGLCILCGEYAKEKCYSESGLRELEISGMCEVCFDDLFAEID